MSNKIKITKYAMLVTLVAIFMAGGCAIKRPVLYPNDHLKEVGLDIAQGDIDYCIKQAKEYVGKQRPAEKVAKQTAFDAAVGAATGAAAGAVIGRAGVGAATGAAGGGALGCVLGIFGSREPDAVFKEFVEHCLRDKGYEPIGWR